MPRATCSSALVMSLGGLSLIALTLFSGCTSLEGQIRLAGEPLRESALLVSLPEICPTPDGMTLDSEGNIIVACPNFADPSYPAVLMKIDSENRARIWARVPVLPETGIACPMGLEFGPDGNLYIADNQGWAKPNNRGRIICLKMKDGQPADWETVASGMSHPNGLRIRDGHIYVTQSLLPDIKSESGRCVSAIYRFKLSDRNIELKNTLADKNLFLKFETENMGCQYGLDGLVFDRAGNLFVGNFGDGTIHKIAFDASGGVASNTLFARSEMMRTTDGICIDEKGNLYVADFSSNTVCMVSPEGKVSVLARSADCDGSRGGLDQPGEPIVRGNELVVTCFDLVTGPDKVNTGHDKPYTISVIKLDGLK